MIGVVLRGVLDDFRVYCEVLYCCFVMVWCYLVLEGGIRMTENKRFKIVDEQFISYYGGTGHKISNEECGFWLWHNKIESQKVCDKLNSILDENEQLKQFKEEVFTKIDMHLRMLPTARDNEFNEDDGDPSLYSGAIYMLETLNKELHE